MTRVFGHGRIMRVGANARLVHGSLLPIPCWLFSRALGASVAVAVARHLHALTCECVRITCFHARWRSLGFDWQEGFPLLFLRLDRWSFCVLGFGLSLFFLHSFFNLSPTPTPTPRPRPPPPSHLVTAMPAATEVDTTTDVAFGLSHCEYF